MALIHSIISWATIKRMNQIELFEKYPDECWNWLGLSWNSNISIEFINKHPDIPWKQIAGLRDILIHQYFGVDLDSIWLVIENRLPLLSESIKSFLPNE